MLLERIQLKNLLSFGPESEEVELRPLNVLIGPNGSGKSNFIEAIGLLRAAPTDLMAPMQTGRGVVDWIWQGDPKADSACIEAVVDLAGQQALRYRVEFGKRDRRFTVIEERLQQAVQHEPATYFEIRDGKAHLRIGGKSSSPADHAAGAPYEHVEYPIDTSKSVLAQVKESNRYAELTCLGEHLERIGLYREWTFGRDNIVRSLQMADLPTNTLAEDNSNLGLVLNRLSRNYTVRAQIVEALRGLYGEASDFHVNIESNTVQVLVQERKGVATIPATRLSDGTIRYLSLLAILCDPDPRSLVCIEEPEIGLHPDILPGLAKLLVEASERCQLVVTTHSDILVDALSDKPESVVVCEKENGQTRARRLSAAGLERWLDKYRLGELWSSGEIGGNRW